MWKPHKIPRAKLDKQAPPGQQELRKFAQTKSKTFLNLSQKEKTIQKSLQDLQAERRCHDVWLKFVTFGSLLLEYQG
jgi:hypothetical protein